MESCSKDKCCQGEKSACCARENEGDMTDFLLEIADCAWTEVLKDKIKEYILSTQKEQMTELAKIVAEGNNQRWQNKMEKKQGCMGFKEKLSSFFSRSKK